MRFMAKIESKSLAVTIRRAVGMLQRGREAAADDVAEHVEDHHVGVVEQVMLLEELDGLADDIAAAAGAGGRAARLDAHHAVIALDRRSPRRAVPRQWKFTDSSASMTVGTSRLVRVKVESCLGSQPICSTRLPSLEKATERLDEVVDLPMPPLP